MAHKAIVSIVKKKENRIKNREENYNIHESLGKIRRLALKSFDVRLLQSGESDILY